MLLWHKSICTLLQTEYTSAHEWLKLIPVASFSRNNAPAAPIPQISIQQTYSGWAGPNVRYGGPTSQITGSAANILVPDTDCDFRGLFYLSKSDLFWQHKRTLKNIRQGVLFLWLSSIKALAPGSTSTHRKNSSNSSQVIMHLDVNKSSFNFPLSNLSTFWPKAELPSSGISSVRERRSKSAQSYVRASHLSLPTQCLKL